MRLFFFLVCAALVAWPGVTANAQETTNILFLSKSSGFQHSVITRKGDAPSHVEKVLTQLASANEANLTATKDASLINAKDLEGFDLVIFYTTGDLTVVGGEKKGMFSGDGNGAMPEHGLADLLTWIENGGAFMGFHCATDTFHGKGEEVTPYIDMIGGEFLTHGRQFKGTLRVVDRDHPAMANFKEDWVVMDEWYMFKNLGTETLHVLAQLDPAEERGKQKVYDVPNYPVVWCRSYGEGRVYYNAMGHREDVWDDPTFQQTVVDAATWAMGGTELDADPNYADLASAEK